jgi:hypothetical protein
MATPQFGLAGSEQALQRGLQGGLQALESGNIGLERQAALAGLRGAPAQSQAFQSFQASPGQEFLREQGRRRELLRFGTGLAAQDFGNQFQRGQQVLQSQQVPAAQAANLAFGTGQQLAGGRLQAGREIAGQQAATTSALSNLINQQGAGGADIIGRGATDIASLLQGFGTQDAARQQQLAQILGNLAVQQGTQATNLPSAAQFLGSSGQIGGIGQLAGGIGGLIGGIKQK